MSERAEGERGEREKEREGGIEGEEEEEEEEGNDDDDDGV